MAMGKHYGSFAKGFMDSLLAVMKMKMMQDFYAARSAHMKTQDDLDEAKAAWYRNRGMGGQAGKDAQTEAWEKEGAAKWGGSGEARGVRNNNPGNIEDGDFAKSQPGYVGSDGRFAKFDSVTSGANALDGLLTTKYDGKTLRDAISTYAPPGENNTEAYITSVSKRLGIGPDDKLNLKDANTLAGLRQSIVSVEQGIPYEHVPDYLYGRGGGGGEGGPALVDASKTINATGGADATQLHPAFASRVAQLSAEAEKATGQPLSFNELHRTTEQQAEIRARHEAMPGGVEAHPAAQAGHSYHEFGAAGDMDDNAASRWARTVGSDGTTPIQKAGLETLPGQTGKNDPLHIQLPKSDWGKTAKADEGTPYQVAGDAGSVTEAGARRAAADLAAHRATEDTKPSDIASRADADTGFNEPSIVARAASLPEPAPIVSSYRPEDSPRPAIPSTPTGPMGPPQRTGAPPNVGITPSSVPNRPVMGPPQRTGAPPNVGITPSSVDMPASRNMPYPGQSDPTGVYASKPNPIAIDRGQRPDLTARSPATTSEANKPAPNAQNVSSPAGPAIPITPRVMPPGFTMVDRPNADPTSRGGGAPQMTALDLSHLWGPNPPVAQRGSAPAAPVSPPQGEIKYSGQPTPVGVGLNPSGNIVLAAGQGARGGQSVPAPMPPPRPQDFDSDVASASRKGGPIQRFNRGGIPTKPTLRFATGGAAPVSSQYPSYTLATAGSPNTGAVTGNALAADQFMTGLPGMTQVDLSNPNKLFYTSYGPGQGGIGGQELTADWTRMTPAQQQQYAQMVAGTWQPPAAATPAAATPAAAAPATVVNPPSVQNITNYPASSTTTVDPTTTTTTGTPGVANSIQAKSYDPNVDQQTGASFTNSSNTGGTNYSVGSDDTLQTQNNQISGTQILSRKGGSIPRFARGGIPSRPTMRYATGGGAAASTLLSPDYSGPVAGGGWAGTPYDQMSPNQQAWATNQQTLLSQEKANANNPSWAGWSQLSGTPAAIWPTAAPATVTPTAEPPPTVDTITQQSPTASVTTIDPTTTTTTGVPGVPNSITAKSYDPNVDQQTGAGYTNTSNAGGTNYSVGSNDLLQTDASGNISGNSTILSRRGGPITPRVRFDDGGGVSPSVAGMPPGLAQQGGASPIPPIYFNPATYAGAGAPVGKGVSNTSAPTYVAGAIPALPMLRGGVVRFADGGDVDPMESQMAYMSMQDDRPQQAGDPEEARIDSAIEHGQDPDATAKPAMYYEPPQPTGQPTAQPSAQGQGGGGNSSLPPGLPPTTPQIKDDDGNPSRGFIAALTGGLHWLGDHLGLIGGAQAQPAIATNPDVQQNRHNFTTRSPDGELAMTPPQRQEINDMADPTHELDPFFRNIAGMEYAYKQMLSLGRIGDANKMAASILHYDQGVSQAHSEAAAKLLYDGHTKEAVAEINNAADALTDGRKIHADYDEKSGQITIKGSDLNGRELWKQIASPYAMLSVVEGMRNGSLQWKSYEDQASKYDPTFRNMALARNKNITARQKEADDAKAQDQANTAIGKMGPQFDEPEAPPTAPTDAPPTLTPVTTPALPGPGKAPTSPQTPAPSPGRSPDTTTAQTPAPPDTSDSSLAARGPTGHGGALPGATGGDIPAAGAQDVDLEHSVAYQRIPVMANQNPDGSAKFFAADGRPIVGGRPMHRPEVMQEAVLKTYAPEVQNAYKQRWDQYNEAVRQNQTALNQSITAMRSDIAADIKSRRDAATADRTEQGLTSRANQQEKMAGVRARDERDFQVFKDNDARRYANIKPLDEQEMAREFNLTPTEGQSGKSMTDYLGRALLSNDDYTGAVQASAKDPNAMQSILNQKYSQSEQNQMAQAIWNGRKYTHDATPALISELVGGAVNGNYKVDAPVKLGDVGDGVDRVMLMIRRNDGTGNTVVMRPEDAQNLYTLYNSRAAVRAQAATNEQARTQAHQKEYDLNAPVRKELGTPGSKYDVAPNQPDLVQ